MSDETTDATVQQEPLVLAVPVPGGKTIYVEGVFPLTRPEWDQFMAVLCAMRPGLVVADGEAT